MTAMGKAPAACRDNDKFSHPEITAKGEPRAQVTLAKLETLWFNTGTLCNLTCENCYIESSPRNDRLVYLTTDEMVRFLDEIESLGLGTREIGFTGGEPFMNPDLIDMVETALARGFRVLVLTNAMRPMMKMADRLAPLRRYGESLVLRVSLDHYTAEKHQTERGPRSWRPAVDGLKWLVESGFTTHVAGRLMWDEPEAAMRAGYRRFFKAEGLAIDADDPAELVLFPEMDGAADVPEITTACWSILGVDPNDLMCANSRMVVKRKGEAVPVVMPCTLLPYDSRFEMGRTLAASGDTVPLNHPHCAKFCVLGGGACSVG